MLSYLKEDLATFVVTDAYNRSVDAVANHGFLLLLGEPAVGKSIIAATLSMAAVDNWGCVPLKLETAADFVDHWNPDENQLIWIDDAFGSIRHERYRTQGWAAALPKVMAAVKKKTRVILTSRDYIYNEARPFLKPSTFPLLKESSVVVDVGDLSGDERRQIVYNHVKLGDQSSASKALMKPHLSAVAAVEPFRPEMARRLGSAIFTQGVAFDRDELVEFARKQKEFLADVYSQLTDDHRAALALVYLSNPLPSPLASDESVQSLIDRFGSTRVRVADSLTHLTPNFLRYGKLPDSSWTDIGWEFRHPTLREGFASYISEHPDLLEVYIAGLDDGQLLAWLDCGNSEERGALVDVPRGLYALVADRLLAIPNRSYGGSGVMAALTREGRKNFFLANRTSVEFLELYLAVDPQLVDDLVRVGAYLNAYSSPAVLAKLHQAGLLPESARLQLISRVSELAVEIPDSTWLDHKDFEVLITQEERADILERVRVELVDDLDDVLSNWRMNEQNDIREYYEPLEEALKKYANALSHHSVAAARLESALSEAIDQKERAAQEQDEEQASSGQLSNRATSQSGAASNNSTRSVFEDVDD